MAIEYWLKGDIPPGPIKAAVITDISRIAEIIKKNIGREAILAGPMIKDVENIVGDVVGHLIELSTAVKAPIITSDSILVKRFVEKEFNNYVVMFPLEVIRKISRNELNHYKLLILIGLRYAYGWLILNHLKHYKPEVQTLSLDPYPQPNATWTLPSLPLSLWHKNFVQLVEIIKLSFK